MIRRAHEAKVNNAAELVIWGSGTPLREFMDSEDMANACVYLMTLKPAQSDPLFTDQMPPLVNIGTGQELSIAALAKLVCEVVGFNGVLAFDQGKPDGVRRKLLNLERLTQLGWQARIELKEGLTRAYHDYLAHLG
jgi:GDP-L-fucose synthase